MKLFEIITTKSDTSKQSPALISRQAGDIVHPKTIKNMVRKYRRKNELPMLLKKQAESIEN